MLNLMTPDDICYHSVMRNDLDAVLDLDEFSSDVVYSLIQEIIDLREQAKNCKHVVPAIDRFYKCFIEDEESGCWNWTLYVDESHGYGKFRVEGKDYGAHRWSYLHFKGDIPDGLVIDHLCRNRRCVNPSHLEVVTVRENTIRGQGITAENAGLDSCRRGHLFTEANTYYRNNRRHCRKCNALRQAEYIERKRNA